MDHERGKSITDKKTDLNYKIAAMEPSTSSGILFKKEDMQVINQAADSLEYYENQNKLLKTKLRQLTDKYNELKHQYNKIWEENHNIRIVKKAGEIS